MYIYVIIYDSAVNVHGRDSWQDEATAISNMSLFSQGINLAENLREFYRRHYSSHYMTVAILSTGMLSQIIRTPINDQYMRMRINKHSKQ